MTFNYANGSISVPGISSLLQSIVSGQRPDNAFSPFNVNVGGSQQHVQQQQMVGVLDDTPQYAKDINSNIKSLQNRDGTSASSDGKNGEGGEKSPGDNVADISGSTLPGFITCDQRLNAIIIRDKRENMPFYEEIIAKLDVPCEVIKIDVAVVDVNKNAERALGLNGINLNGTTGSGKWNATISTGASRDSKNGSITGTLGIIRNMDVTVAINAIEKSGTGQTLSKPSVLTLDNVAAILETDKIHYATVTGANSSNAYTQTATTKLQVVPHIIPGDVDGNGKRKMKLFVDISDGSFEADESHSVTQHSLNTQAVLYEGQSLLIGGYNTESSSRSNGGIPFLKDIPLVGGLFKHSDRERVIKERVYVISPSVVEIRSDDHTYDRFLQQGQLTANPSLEQEEFPLNTKWPQDDKNPTRKLHKK
jgi:type III secretion protein C